MTRTGFVLLFKTPLEDIPGGETEAYAVIDPPGKEYGFRPDEKASFSAKS